MKKKEDRSDKDLKMAAFCRTCAVCNRARRRQQGFAYWFVQKIEGDLCPFCRAYERVYGRKAHEPTPEQVANEPI
jgi:hypothetical protein